MQSGKRGLFVLQDFGLALGVLRDLLNLKLIRTGATTAIGPAGCFNETWTVKADIERRKAEARYQAQRLLAHPR